MNLEVDIDELPTSYSAIKRHEDKNVYVATGYASTCDDDRPVIIARFKRIGLDVEGGRSMRDAVLAEPEDKWADVILNYAMRDLAIRGRVASFLRGLMEEVYSKAVKAGIVEQQQRTLAVLGIE